VCVDTPFADVRQQVPPLQSAEPSQSPPLAPALPPVAVPALPPVDEPAVPPALAPEVPPELVPPELVPPELVPALPPLVEPPLPPEVAPPDPLAAPEPPPLDEEPQATVAPSAQQAKREARIHMQRIIQQPPFPVQTQPLPSQSAVTASSSKQEP
jgi:hypothetical protein